MTDLVAIPSSHDLKTKFPGGSGGFSDGSVVCIRRTLSATAVLIGPSAGKTWRALPDPSGDSETSGSILALNFDLSVNATVESAIVLADGTVPSPSIVTDVVAFSTAGLLSGNGAIESGMVFSADMKLRFRLIAPLPTKRVLLTAIFVEYDMPKTL